MDGTLVADTEDSSAGGEWLHLRRTMVYGELPPAAAYSLHSSTQYVRSTVDTASSSHEYTAGD